jgi:hypothetical protein
MMFEFQTLQFSERAQSSNLNGKYNHDIDENRREYKRFGEKLMMLEVLETLMHISNFPHLLIVLIHRFKSKAFFHRSFKIKQRLLTIKKHSKESLCLDYAETFDWFQPKVFTFNGL